jgi:hypothetical protein
MVPEPRPPLYDSAAFWVVACAVPTVAGLAVIDHSHVAAMSSPWSSRAFQVGFGVLVVAALMFLWGIVLFVAHQHAKGHMCPDPSAHEVRTRLDFVAPPIAPVPTPPAPSKPVVASPRDDIGEVIRDQPKDRVFLGPEITPQYLTGFFRDHTSAQAKTLVALYLHKWMPVSGRLDNVDVSQLWVFVSLEPGTYEGLSWVHCRFSLKWTDRLSILTRGTHIKLVGRLDEV